MRNAAILTIALLAGCGEAPLKPEPDGALRIALSRDCIATLPEGPKATHYNDWAEAVEQCDTNAYHQTNACIGQEAKCWEQINPKENTDASSD